MYDFGFRSWAHAPSKRRKNVRYGAFSMVKLLERAFRAAVHVRLRAICHEDRGRYALGRQDLYTQDIHSKHGRGNDCRARLADARWSR